MRWPSRWWRIVLAVLLVVAGVVILWQKGGTGSTGLSAASSDENRRELIRQQAVIVHLAQTVRLLNTPEVHTELGLAPEQVEVAKDLASEAQETFAGLRAAPPAERPAKVRDVWLPKAQSMEERIQGLVTPKQRRRLRQIVLQKQLGAIALLVPPVVEELTLSGSQQRAIEDIVGETLAASDRHQGMLGLVKLAEVARKARRRALDVLTPEQQAAWNNLLDKPT
jgi:hypothetical protein